MIEMKARKVHNGYKIIADGFEIGVLECGEEFYQFTSKDEELNDRINTYIAGDMSFMQVLAEIRSVYEAFNDDINKLHHMERWAENGYVRMMESPY